MTDPVEPVEPPARPWWQAEWLWLILTLAAVTALFFRPVPSGNELLYLISPKYWWRPEPLDWTFSERWNEHLLFNLVVGAVAQVVRIEVLGWCGRIVSWTLVLAAIFRLGRRLDVSPPLVTFAILIWIALGQTFAGDEWVFKGFEAKVLAYGCLFLSLEQLLVGRLRTAGALLGLSFTLHPSVGLGACCGFGFALLALRPGRASLLAFALPAAALALPGAVVGATIARATAGADPLAWWFTIFQRAPWHFNLRSFDKHHLIGMAVVFACSWHLASLEPAERKLKVILAFLAGVGLLFLSGVVAFETKHFGWMETYPFRVFPMMLPLLGLLLIVRFLSRSRTGGRHPATTAIVLGAALSFGNPFQGWHDVLDETRHLHAPADDMERAMRWVSSNTPPDAIVLLPPTRLRSFYLTGRPQVVNFWAFRYDRFAEWRRRLDDLVGPLNMTTPQPPSMVEFERRFNAHPPEKIEALAQRYHASILISAGAYSFPELHRDGSYRVYDLRGAAPGTGSEQGMDDRLPNAPNAARWTVAPGQRIR